MTEPSGFVGLARPSTAAPLFGPSVGDLPVAPAEVDLRHLITYFEAQFWQDCLGCTIEGAHHIATGGVSKRISPLCIWRNARLRERARVGAPITDVGCQVVDALNGLISPGVYARDANDDDPSKGNDLQSWAELVGLAKFDPSNIVTIENGDIDRLVAHMAAGHGTGFCMPVDLGYTLWRGTSNVWQGLKSESRGYHGQAGAGADAESIWAWSSWGSDMGNGGIIRIARGWAESYFNGMFAITGGPVFA